MSILTKLKQLFTPNPIYLYSKLENLYIDLLNHNKEHILNADYKVYLSSSPFISDSATLIHNYEGKHLPIGFGSRMGNGYNILNATSELRFYDPEKSNKIVNHRGHTDILVFKVNGEFATIKQFIEHTSESRLLLSRKLVSHPNLDPKIKILVVNRYLSISKTKYEHLRDDYIEHDYLSKAKDEYDFLVYLRNSLSKSHPELMV